MTTETMWTQHVAAWRASGLTAAEFSDRRGFAAATLRWWSSRLRRTKRSPRIAFARLVPTASTPSRSHAPLVVELAGARVLVPTGVARQDLAVVLDVLDMWRGGGAR